MIVATNGSRNRKYIGTPRFFCYRERMRKIFCLCCAVFLAGCSGSYDHDIQFIGVSTGSLMSDIESLHFQTTFPKNEHGLVGIASFAKPMDGYRVNATWFSPDERRMPMGRSTIMLESGATIARFSLQSTTDWNPAPFTLRIDVYRPGETEELVSSGSTVFFIGMNQAQIDEYNKEFAAWSAADAEMRSRWEAQRAREAEIVRLAALLVRDNDVEIAARYDIDGNGSEEFFVTSKQHGPTGGGNGVIASVQTSVFSLMSASGSSIVSLENARGGRVLRSGQNVLYQSFPSGDIAVTLLASGTVSIAWNADDAHCAMDVIRDGDRYRVTDPVCR